MRERTRRLPRSSAILISLAISLALPDSARAQARGDAEAKATDAFLRAARAASERYRDRRIAIADGYRLIGPDFPGMGEHWIHLGRLMDGRFEPGAPEILSYAKLEGNVTLTGVAYALPVPPGASPPPGPAPDAVWHFHDRTVDGESFAPTGPVEHAGAGDDEGTHRPAAMGAPDSQSGTRVAVLHAWIWLDNPAGVFARENWALPFARQGLQAPRAVPPAAAKALALAGGGDRFLVRALSSRELMERKSSEAILSRYAERARRWARGRDADVAPSADALEPLIEIWTDLWAELLAAAPEEARPGLIALRDH